MLLIPSLKSKTKHLDIDLLPDSTDFYLPIDAYRGQMEILVSNQQRVLKYQCIASLDGTFATKLHAPVSGIVKGIVSINGKTHIHLENDFNNEEISNKPVDISTLTLEQFIDILNNSGIEGSGGSRFPTQLKYQLNNKPVQTLIFNGVECEPYLTADAVLMKNKANQLVKSAQLIKSLVKANKIVFVLEKQNKDIAKHLLETAQILKIELKVCLVTDSYPQGGELQIIKAVTKMELKKRSIPLDYGILVNNVGTLWAIYKAVFERKPYTERILTISGNRSVKQGNYQVKIGTPIFHLLNQTQNNYDSKNQSVILGGAMMGKFIEDTLMPINKGSGGVLLLKKQNTNIKNCIKCGDCVTVCPQHLMPLEFVRHQQNTEALASFHLNSCIECGACAYVCPSDVPLMESIFNGKKLIVV